MANRRHPVNRGLDGHDDDIRDINEPVDNAKRVAALTNLLDEAWDPLGLYVGPRAERPAPARYRFFVPGLLTLLDGGAKPAEVAWHLRDIAHTEFDLPPVGNEGDVADLLLRWHALWA